MLVFTLAALVPGSALAQVSRLGAWTTGLTHTPGAGTNRVLIFAAGYENAASTDIGISSVTFGGRPLTRIAGESAGTSNRNRSELWYLNAAGIAAASGSTFVVTWTPSTPATVMFAAATYANVDQASPIEDFDSTFTNSATPNPITLTMTKSANGMVIGNFVCGNSGSYTWNNSFAEGFDQVGAATATLSGGDQAQTTGGTVVVSATHSGPNRQAVAATSLRGVATNQPPVLAPIGPRSVNEGVLLTFVTSATDPDGTLPTFTSSTLPTGATLTGNGNGTATFNWTPTFLQSGGYPVVFRATDGTLIDTEIVTITVNDVTQPPVLATIGPRSVTEGANLNFNISATDPDGTTPTFTSSTLPTGSALTNNGNGTAAFNWTPTFLQAGGYLVVFRATDGTLIDTEIVTITVNEAGNQPPVLATIGPRSVNEGVLLTFNISATDPDGTLPTFTSSTLPTGATLTGNGNGTATFNWTPTFSQAGSYPVTFRATDAVLIDTEVVTLTVNEAGNQPPVLATVGPKSVNEGGNLNFLLTATDPDGTLPTFTSSTLPTGSALTNNGNGTATFNWTPTFSQAGSYPVTFRATDGTLIDTEIVTITVSNVNLPPDQVAVGPKSVNEGGNLNFLVTATDPDGTIPTLTCSTLPTGSTYTNNGNGTATFNWTPTFSQAGSYPVTFRATDGALVDTEIVTITVNNVNLPPDQATIGPKSVNEGGNLNFLVTATDPDGTVPTLSSSAPPPGSTYTLNGNGTATFNWTPDFTQSGSYPVTFRASDGTLPDSEIVTITVNSVNLPPDLAAIGPKSVNEETLLTFNVSATDPDGTIPSLSSSTLPTGSSYTLHGDGTATFTWTPTVLQSGAYPVIFRATDGAQLDTEMVTITVNDVSQPPVLASIGPRSVNEGVRLTFNVSASDPDGTTPTFTSSTLPSGATFTDHLDGTATFDWTPTILQSGTYPVTFRATDGALIDTEVVTITVADINQPPVWSAAADTVILEATAMSRVLLAIDPDGQVLQLSSGPLPAHATFFDSGNGRGTLTFTPDFMQAGLYLFTFFATDGLLSDTLAFVVAVSEVGNQEPVFDSIGPQTVNEGALLAVRVVARDPESTAVSLVASGLPQNALFVDSGDGVGGLVFTPSFVQAGNYTVNLLAVDHGVPPITRIQAVSITVQDGNRPPVLDSIGPRFAVREEAFAMDVQASDSTAPAGNVLIFTTLGLPAGSTFVDSGNGHGRFRWTPTALQVGIYNVTFTVVDNATPALNDQEVVQITVLSANHTPVLATIGPRFVTEGQTLQFTVSATDADGTIPSLQIANPPPSAVLVDNLNGTAVFTYVPAFVEAGLRSVEFRASDGVSLDKEIVLIQVQEAGNQPPTMTASGPPSRNERDTLVCMIRANDPDSTQDPITLVSPLPANASLVDHGNGTATFQFVPWFTQQGAYSLTFAASDGTFADSVTYHFTIQDIGNQAPFLHALGNNQLAIPDKTFREELRDSLYVAASDFDSTLVRLQAAGLPTGATFTDAGNNVGRLAWKPTFSQAGLYQVTVFARDTQDTMLYDSQLVSLSVNNFFPSPVWNPTIVKNYVLAEGSTLNVNMATIPIDTVPRFKANHKPGNSIFTDNLNGTCSFNFQPSYFQAGIDSALLIAYHPLDTSVQTPLVLRFTVTNTAQAPIWRVRSDTSIGENVQLILLATADDPDATVPALSAQNLPAGATFDTPFQGSGSATGRISWRPNYTQQGTYFIRLLASDGTGVDTMQVGVTVIDAGNQPPTFTISPRDSSLVLPATLSLRVRAVDADGVIPSLRVERLPRNASFVDSGNGSGLFRFIPDTTQTDSVYAVDFFASDGVAQSLVTVTYRIYDFIRGDTNGDTRITSSDGIYLVNYVFKGGPPPVPVPAGDVDKSGTINSSDIIYLVNFLFKSGPPPPP